MVVVVVVILSYYVPVDVVWMQDLKWMVWWYRSGRDIQWMKWCGKKWKRQ